MTDRDLARMAGELASIERAAEVVFRDGLADTNERAFAEAAFRLARPLKVSIEKWLSARVMRAALK